MCNKFLEEILEEQDILAVESILKEKKENLVFISKNFDTKKFKIVEKNLIQLGTISLKNGKQISLLNHRTTLCRFTKLSILKDKILIATKCCLKKN